MGYTFTFLMVFPIEMLVKALGRFVHTSSVPVWKWVKKYKTKKIFKQKKENKGIYR